MVDIENYIENINTKFQKSDSLQPW